MLATKDERVHTLQQILNTNNMMRGPGSEHDMLIMSQDYDDVDPLVPTAIITGVYTKNRDQGYEVHLLPVHSHSFSCHWKRNRDRSPQRTLGLPA